MATNVMIPVALPTSADDYIEQWGAGTAAVYLEYGTASPPTDGTASTLLTSDLEHYEFWVAADPDYYYRFRVGDGTDFASYSAVFQAPRGYCTLQEVVRDMEVTTADYDEVQDLIVEASDFIRDKICGGRSFHREPVGSDETVLTLDIEFAGESQLSFARSVGLDIVSLSKVEIADYTGDTYTELTNDADGYYLLPDKPISGQPYTDIALSDQATYTTFPTGRRVVRLTGVFGWANVPALVRRATVDLVRFWWRSRSTDDEPVGFSPFGQPVYGPGLPKSVRELYRSDYAWHGYVG